MGGGGCAEITLVTKRLYCRALWLGRTCWIYIAISCTITMHHSTIYSATSVTSAQPPPSNYRCTWCSTWTSSLTLTLQHLLSNCQKSATGHGAQGYCPQLSREWSVTSVRTGSLQERDWPSTGSPATQIKSTLVQSVTMLLFLNWGKESHKKKVHIVKN